MKLNKSEIKKILIIKLRGIGDVVLSTIIFDPLIEEFSDAKIDFLVNAPGSHGLKDLPILNKVHVFEYKTLKRMAQFLALRRIRYDLVIDLYSNPASAQATLLSGARYRIGFPYRGRKYAYNIYGPSQRNKLHSADLHLSLLKNIGITCSISKLYFKIDNKSQLFANKYFVDNNLNNNLVLGVSPSGSWNSKKCPPYKLAELATLAIEKYNAKILILWGPGDKEEATEIFERIPKNGYLAPDTNIIEMGAFINNCTVFIANDSGPMHIAVALGVPTLGIHGPTDPRLQGPYGNKNEFIILDSLDCIICNLLECPKNKECFNNLPIYDIFAKFESLLTKNNLITE